MVSWAGGRAGERKGRTQDGANLLREGEGLDVRRRGLRLLELCALGVGSAFSPSGGVLLPRCSSSSERAWTAIDSREAMEGTIEILEAARDWKPDVGLHDVQGFFF